MANPIETWREQAHALPAADVLSHLDVSADAGLSEKEARIRIGRHGPNTIVSRRKTAALGVLLHQFHSPVVYLLAAAAALAFWFGEWEEAGAIAVVLGLNASIGFLTELKAARSMPVAGASISADLRPIEAANLAVGLSH